MAKQKSLGRRWYVIHTYSGYEDQVRDSLMQRIETLGMQDKIYNVIVPTERTVKIKNGKRKTIVEKIFPGYVMVEMEVMDDSWYVVRNTPGVTGFVGSGTTPVPMSETEVTNIIKRMKDESPTVELDIEKGNSVIVVDGPFKNFEGKIIEVDTNKSKVKVLCNMFGRETPIELDFLQIKKI